MSTAKKADDKVDAWMPLWIGSYLADTTHLSRDEHGGYFLLLMAYWRNKGPLADTGNRLANICKATPAEWKRLRPVLEEFFGEADGYWSHKRADEELIKAGVHKAKAVSRAKAGAEARWKDHPKHANKDASSNAQSNASSIAQAVLNGCPTPPPLPEEPFIPPNTHTDGPVCVGEGWVDDDLDPVPAPLSVGTQAGALCRKLRQAGIADVNPGHPILQALLQAGAEESEFLGAATAALGKTSPFAYVIGTVTRQRQAAAKTAQTLHTGPLPATETAYDRSMRERMELIAPAIAAKRPGASRALNPMEVLDGLIAASPNR